MCRYFFLLTLISSFTLSSCLTRKTEEPAQATTPSASRAGYPEDERAPAQAAAPKKSNVPSGVQTTYSGLQYEVLRPGTGRRPTSYNRVKVHYHGTLPNGKVFDSSVQRGKPSSFGLNQVIAGWTEGIPLMREGAKYRFTIPGNLAYGSKGSPPNIGPNQTLIFEVELLEVLY